MGSRQQCIQSQSQWVSHLGRPLMRPHSVPPSSLQMLHPLLQLLQTLQYLACCLQSLPHHQPHRHLQCQPLQHQHHLLRQSPHKQQAPPQGQVPEVPMSSLHLPPLPQLAAALLPGLPTPTLDLDPAQTLHLRPWRRSTVAPLHLLTPDCLHQAQHILRSRLALRSAEHHHTPTTQTCCPTAWMTGSRVSIHHPALLLHLWGCSSPAVCCQADGTNHSPKQIRHLHVSKPGCGSGHISKCVS
mmetsp:Transcript_55570/g.130110  ORF Transcript_55570/g.130110 Transcript_55570/m.130110 type:complete len:242 (+) Transcript_55570:1394-2119(+)